MLYRISVTERGLTGIANIFRSRLSRLDDLLGAGTVPLTTAFLPDIDLKLFNNLNSLRSVNNSTLLVHMYTCIFSNFSVTCPSDKVRICHKESAASQLGTYSIKLLGIPSY